MAADRTTALAHELRNLLDGSLRWVALAERGLPRAESASLTEDLERTRRQLDTVREALERMAAIVRAAMSSANLPLGSTLLSGYRATLGEAVDHAVDVVRPAAAEIGITVSVRIDRDAGVLAAGAMYSLILNALRNAVESIGRATDGQPGAGWVEVRLTLETANGARGVVLEVEDDGVGPPAEGLSAEVGAATFAGGRGIGLALGRQLVREIGGALTLSRGRGPGARPGAVLRATWPAPAVEAESEAGHG